MAERRYEFKAVIWTTSEGSEEEARGLCAEFLELATYNGCGAELDESPAEVEEEA